MTNISYFHCNGNDVQFNGTHVWLQSSEHKHLGSGYHGFYLKAENFRRGVSFYSARALIKSQWVITNNVHIEPTHSEI